MTIKADERGICPHCKTPNRFEHVKESCSSGTRGFDSSRLIHGKDIDEYHKLESCRCTECGEIILFLDENMIYPLGSARSPTPKEVPQDIAKDYNESCLVEQLSKKAAAALARRCLQNMLHERGIKKKNLNEEIDEAIKTLPSYLGEAIDAIRNIGNFATHPIKFQNTGEIVEVEEGETEWILDVIEQLFDFYYVQPAVTKVKKVLLNAKLKAVGKPPMK